MMGFYIFAIIICTVALVLNMQQGRAIWAGIMGFCLALNIFNLVTYITTSGGF